MFFKPESRSVFLWDNIETYLGTLVLFQGRSAQLRRRNNIKVTSRQVFIERGFRIDYCAYCAFMLGLKRVCRQLYGMTSKNKGLIFQLVHVKPAIPRWQSSGLLTNRAGEPEPGVFGSQEPEPEPEPLEKKVRSRSRSRKKICRLPSPAYKYLI